MCVTPLVLQLYFRDLIGSLNIHDIDGWSGIMNYHSDFHIWSMFRMYSPISLTSHTQPPYQQMHDNSPAKLQ